MPLVLVRSTPALPTHSYLVGQQKKELGNTSEMVMVGMRKMLIQHSEMRGTSGRGGQGGREEARC